MSAAQRSFPGDGKAPVEKSKFAQTCNRLSLFLKEKRNLGFEISAKIDPKGVKENSQVKAQQEPTTIDLLSNIDHQGEKKLPQEDKTVNPIPEYVILDSSCEIDDDATIVASSSKAVISKAPKTAQMTIFYGGKVVVLDEVPADTARDMMLVAQNGSSCNNKKAEKQVEQLASTSKDTIINHPELRAKDSDLPIARRASLHKFLAKRKDRANVRAPYYNPNPNQNQNQNQNQNVNINHYSPGASSSGTELSFDLNM